MGMQRGGGGLRFCCPLGERWIVIGIMSPLSRASGRNGQGEVRAVS